MATRYWVGGSGTWNSSNTANWSATSGGSSGASVPTGADDVIFNSSSSASLYSVTLNVADNLASNNLTISGPASGNVSFSSTSYYPYISVYRNLTIASSGITVTSLTSLFSITGGASGDISVETALTNSGISLDSAAGIKKLIAALSCKDLSIDSLSKLTTNGYDITCSGLLTVGRGFITNSTESIYLTGNNQTIYNVTEAQTSTGTVNIRCNYAGSTGTRTFTSSITTSSISSLPNIYISAGSDTVSIFNSIYEQYKNLDFTGFSGSISGTGTASIFGNLTFSSGMTVTNFTGTINMAAVTAGTSTLTTAGKSCVFALATNSSTGYVGTVQLGGNFTTTKAITAGTASVTFATAGYAVTSLSLSQTAGTLTLGATTWTLTGSGTVLNLGSGTTQSLGTSTFVFNSASSKTATVNTNSLPSITQSGAGSLILTYTGPINIENLTTTVSPTALQFTSSQTATITGSFNVSGTVGNLVTITSSTSSIAATLSKSSGTINSNYLSLKDSTATGGAVWYAGSASTNVSNNTGWIFSGPSDGMLFFFS
jgi:hypothetical protein